MKGIMPPGTRQLLMPASYSFIWTSLIVAFFANIVASIWFWGRSAWAPDLLLVTLIFWNIHQPQKIGMGVAFLFGLLMDVQVISLLGQHALSYTLLSFLATALHRRILWFKTVTQALQLFPLFLLSHMAEFMLRYLFSRASVDWTLMFAPMIEVCLWPIFSVILLSPQRRTPDPDATRPL